MQHTALINMQNEKVAVYNEKNKLITTANQPNYDLLGFGYIPVHNKKNTCISNIFNHTVIKNPF